MSDRERVCVQCGSPGREERFSCDECGGTIVETEAAQAVTVPAAPPPRSGSGNWAPPGYSTVDPEWDAPAVTPPEHPVRRAFRVRTKRAIAVATLMSLVVAAGVVTIGVLVVQTFAKEPTPISKDMRGYASGQGAGTRRRASTPGSRPVTTRTM